MKPFVADADFTLYVGSSVKMCGQSSALGRVVARAANTAGAASASNSNPEYARLAADRLSQLSLLV
jgi:hypothetical protein